MARERTLQIRVSQTELATLEAVARLEKLPVGTFIRRRLLLEAEQRGIVPRFDMHNGGAEVSEASRAAVAP